jgi:hypothetical protein
VDLDFSDFKRVRKSKNEKEYAGHYTTRSPGMAHTFLAEN